MEMASYPLFPENEVCRSNLDWIFKQAFYKTSVDEDENLVVHVESGSNVIVMLRPDIKFISFFAGFEIDGSVCREKSHTYVNTLNQNLNMARFWVMDDRPQSIFADYHFSFEFGISSRQVISAFRLFSHVTVTAQHLYDPEG